MQAPKARAKCFLDMLIGRLTAFKEKSINKVPLILLDNFILK